MSGKTISNSETRLEALQLQSSAYGVVIPYVFGVTRITGNLVWQGGFRAVPHTTEQGGKGGGVRVRNTTFTYVASVIMGLAHGPITGIPRAWRGKKLYSGGVTPSQVVGASESYAVPGSGAMTYSLVHGSTFVAVLSVTTTVGVGVDAYERLLIDGEDFAIAAGVLTVFNDYFRGLTLAIAYQYTSGSVSVAALDELGLSFKVGAIAQAVWSGLSGFSAESLGYSGLAYVAGQDYDLGSTAQVENHGFEVVGPMAYHLGSSVPDVDPALMLRAVLTHARAGAAFPAERLDDWSTWSDQCVASGLLVSPALTEQVPAAEVIRTAAELTNASPVWSSGRLKMVPYADTAETGNGRTYTPDTTPVYDLDDECYIPRGVNDPPVKAMLKSPSQRFNHVRIEFLNRGNQYSVEIAEAKDETDIAENGLRSKPILRAHWICEPAIARRVAQVVMQRSLAVCAEYEFSLPWHFALLEPADLVTLTDTRLQMSLEPVRLTVIEEGPDGDLVVTAEDYPAGTSSAAVYPSQAGSGYAADYNAAPGNVATPAFFESPAALTTSGIEVCAAVKGASSSWGGCTAWVSLDGSNYKQVGAIYGGSRYGTLSGGVSFGAVSLGVQGLGDEQLLSGSSADAEALSTLCYVGGSNPEYFAYETATLTGAGAYTLAGLVRAAYGTPAASHSSGDRFIRVDDRIVRSGSLDPAMVGQTISFKFTSFNVFGLNEQSLADVTAYTYTVTGAVGALGVPTGPGLYRTGADPAASSFVANGSTWQDTSTGKQYERVAGAWQPVVGSGSVSTGELDTEAATTVLTDSSAGPVTLSRLAVPNIPGAQAAVDLPVVSRPVRVRVTATFNARLTNGASALNGVSAYLSIIDTGTGIGFSGNKVQFPNVGSSAWPCAPQPVASQTVEGVTTITHTFDYDPSVDNPRTVLLTAGLEGTTPTSASASLYSLSFNVEVIKA